MIDNLDEGQRGMIKATEDLLDSVKELGLKMNFLDAVCKFCHKKFGSAQSEKGFEWDVEFICDDDKCKKMYLVEIIKKHEGDKNV